MADITRDIERIFNNISEASSSILNALTKFRLSAEFNYQAERKKPSLSPIKAKVKKTLSLKN